MKKLIIGGLAVLAIGGFVAVEHSDESLGWRSSHTVTVQNGCATHELTHWGWVCP